MTNNMTSPKSILVIGASGATGLECIRHLVANHSTKPRVHGFCRDASKIGEQDKKLCASVIEGNARNEQDVERALDMSQADTVIVSIGNGENVAKNDIRTASAQVLVRVAKKPQFQHVRFVVVSSIGAGSSKVIVGMGIGKLISYHLRHILKDHTGQEAAFDAVRNRTLVVRATGLTNNQAMGKLVEFGDKEKPPTIKTDRADLAAWITQEICGGTKPLGDQVINVTGVKQ